ncbi:MAG: SurA N-terminal domain-containing protein [bacterium]
MNRIRKRGQTWLAWFAVIFVISVFAGLGGQYVFNVNRTGVPGAAAAGMPELIAEIGDSKVKYDRFNELYNNAQKNREANPSQGKSPQDDLDLMNQVYKAVLADEAIRAYGKRHSIKVGEDEVRKAIETAKAQFKKDSSDSKKPDTILGEIRQNLEKGEAEHAAFLRFLEAQGWDEQKFYEITRDELLLDKVRKNIEEQISERKSSLVELVKKTVDDQLEGGTEFADLARLFSYDFYSRDEGGEVPSPLGLGFFSENFDKEVFSLKNPGDVTPWFENEYGFEKVQLIEKIAQTKDKKQEEILDDLKKEFRRINKKEDSYEPTEEELAWTYEAKYTKVKIRHITLNTQGTFDRYLYENRLAKAFPFSVKDPYIKGYRAMQGEPNVQPEQPEPEIEAKLHIVAEEFGILEEGKILPERIKEAISLLKEGKGPKAASWYVPAEGEDAEKAAAEPYVSSPPSIEDEKGPPRYEEAVLAFEEARDVVYKESAQSYYFVAWCYDTWRKDEAHKSELKKTAEELDALIEKGYRDAIAKYEYQPYYHLALAEFLSEKGDKENAVAAADQALKYAGYDTTVLTTIRGLFVKLEEDQKADEVKARIDQAQKKQRELQQGAGGTSIPITIPPPESSEGDGKTIEVEVPAPSGEGGE